MLAHLYHNHGEFGGVIAFTDLNEITDDSKTPCYIRTEAQKKALRRLLSEQHRRYPRALIVGHSDLDPHNPCCHSFDVVREY